MSRQSHGSRKSPGGGGASALPFRITALRHAPRSATRQPARHDWSPDQGKPLHPPRPLRTRLAPCRDALSSPRALPSTGSLAPLSRHPLCLDGSRTQYPCMRGNDLMAIHGPVQAPTYLHGDTRPWTPTTSNALAWTSPSPSGSATTTTSAENGWPPPPATIWKTSRPSTARSSARWPAPTPPTSSMPWTPLMPPDGPGARHRSPTAPTSCWPSPTVSSSTSPHSPWPRPSTTASRCAKRWPPTCHWPWTTSATLPAASAHRKAASPKSTRTPSPTTSTSPWAWSARSSRGTSRC